MTIGQRVTFEYCGVIYIFTVNQALVEGEGDKKPGALERGMISKETYIIFEASPNSGIKVCIYFSVFFGVGYCGWTNYA